MQTFLTFFFYLYVRAEKDKEAMKREADDAKAAMDALSRDKVSLSRMLLL